MFKAKKRHTKAVVDCSNDEVITEQSHKHEVDINNIVKRHGVDLIAKTAAMKTLVFDDVTGNDFQEAMFKVTKAQESFDTLPSELRKKFNYDAAMFLDWIHEPANRDDMVRMGLAVAPENTDIPIQVEVVNPTTPSPDQPDPVTP